MSGLPGQPSTPTCDQCRQPLDRASLLCDLTVCCDCARRALRASRKGTRPVVVARELRDAGQSAAFDARPDDRAKVDAAIRQLAALGQPFSANDAREIHGVKGPVVGAAFTAARKAGLIRAVGFTTSDEAKTHAHPVRVWTGAQQAGAAA